MEKNNYLSLEEISQNYPFILIDTCSLFTSNGKYEPSDIPISEKLKNVKKESKALKTFISFIKKDFPIYITRGIKEESFKNSHYSYKSSIKRLDFPLQKDYISKEHHRKLVEIHRGIRESIRTRNKIKELLEEKNRIFSPEQNELLVYKKLKSENFHLKNECGLSKVDFDFLISGLTLTYERDPVALISNDSGINNAWQNLLSREGIPRDCLGFFMRKDLNLYLEK